MEKYYICSFSGGKDSTAMLLRLLELKEPINEVIWCDTYAEFPQMYEHIEKIKKGYTVEQLDKRFKLEEEWLAANKNIRSRAFFEEWRNLINEDKAKPF